MYHMLRPAHIWCASDSPTEIARFTPFIHHLYSSYVTDLVRIVQTWIIARVNADRGDAHPEIFNLHNYLYQAKD